MSLKRCQPSFMMTAAPATPPSSSWTSMLPLPGSRYASTRVFSREHEQKGNAEWRKPLHLVLH